MVTPDSRAVCHGQKQEMDSGVDTTQTEKQNSKDKTKCTRIQNTPNTSTIN